MLGLTLLAGSFVAATADGAWGALALGAIGPDTALLLGIGRGLEPGQLHPRAVPLYNALHSAPGPIAVIVLGATGVVGPMFLVAGLAWATHVAIDRAVGYGLRTRDGHQRWS